MPNGFYKLSETKAPAGYVILTKDIYFTVSDGAVTLTDKDGKKKTYSNVELLDDNTTIAVKNTPGASLPHTGGPGTLLFYIFGAVLTSGSAILLIARRRINGPRFFRNK
jgi:LPXTG-motif cell wall-anchored protein